VLCFCHGPTRGYELCITTTQNENIPSELENTHFWCWLIIIKIMQLITFTFHTRICFCLHFCVCKTMTVTNNTFSLSFFYMKTVWRTKRWQMNGKGSKLVLYLLIFLTLLYLLVTYLKCFVYATNGDENYLFKFIQILKSTMKIMTRTTNYFKNKIYISSNVQPTNKF